MPTAAKEKPTPLAPQKRRKSAFGAEANKGKKAKNNAQTFEVNTFLQKALDATYGRKEEEKDNG